MWAIVVKDQSGATHYLCSMEQEGHYTFLPMEFHGGWKFTKSIVVYYQEFDAEILDEIKKWRPTAYQVKIS